MNVQFYKGISDDYAKDGLKSKSVKLPDGAITFTNEGHIWVKESTTTSKMYGGSDSDDELVDVDSTEIAIGGISKNTDLSEMTAAEVLKQMFSVEYAPLYTAYSAGAVTGNATYVVGSTMPAKTTFSVSGAKAARAVADRYTATGGAVSTSIDNNSDAWDEKGAGKTIDDRTAIEITGTVSIAKGATTVKTSKGAVTRKTASDSTTLISNASNNSEIGTDNTFIAHSNLKPTSATVYFAYPIYVNGTQLTLGYDSTNYKTTIDEIVNSDPKTHLTVEVPSTYTNVQIKQENPTKVGVYDVTIAAEAQPADEDNDRKVGKATYTKYVYSTTTQNKGVGKLNIQITFNIA